MYSKLKEVSYKVRIGALTRRDVVERMTLRLLYRIGLLSPQVALEDTADYLGISVSDAIARARDARRAHKSAWYTAERKRELDIQSFSGEDDNYLFTLPLHWWLHTWHFVPQLSPGPRILEYGCGTAEMTKWLLKRYPQFEYTVADLAVASTLQFVRYRFKGKPVRILEIGLGKEGLPLRDEYDFIACIDVLEHCSDPLMIVEHLYEHLASAGILYLNSLIERKYLENDHDSENLRGAALKREEVIDFLESNCHAIKPISRLHQDTIAITGWEALGVYRRT